ncbi:hypothetical protein EV424DRAFT_1343139 [Suillus variegatus]|nr:hypothetical protein EV424DRAFT_1343139 [Suillus variegatus]
MSKKLIPMKINKLMTQLKTTTSNPSLSEEDKCIICIVLQEKLNQLELTKHNKTRDHLAAKIRLENESPATDIEEVLKLLPRGKAPSVDGIPYEFWKWLNDKAKATPKKRNNNSPFNIAECLTAVFNDIESHGIMKDSKFSEGLIHPLYKKKDRREIANYRPITLLNSDYKTFTKALAPKLT